MNVLSKSWFWGTLLCSGVALGTIRHVPSEFPSVQSALDAIADQDTVLVATGVYVEALVAPPGLSFTLMGESWLDTLMDERVLIDPSTLPGSDSLTALRLQPATTVVICAVDFRNGPEMYQSPRTRSGGILHSARLLIMHDCRLDSLYLAIAGSNRVRLFDCTFINCQGQCVRTGTLPLVASNTVFSGQAFYMVSCGDSSHFDGCFFRDNRLGHLLVAGNDGVRIENCTFGPYGPYPFAAVSIAARSGCVIQNSNFSDFADVQSVLEITVDCPNVDPSPIEIRNVTISDFTRGPALDMSCQTQHAGYIGTLFAVSIAEGNTQTGLANGVLVAGSAQINGSILSSLHPPNIPDCFMTRTFPNLGDSSAIHHSLFESGGKALFAQNIAVDARQNWWGDSTGPFHPELNPQGQGGEVGNGILFEPWVTDTSTSSNERSPNFRTSRFEVSVNPNPFNSEFRIAIAGFTRDDFSIRLFDLQGRERAVLQRGALTGGILSFTAPPTLASGVYFVVAADNNYRTALKAILLK